MTLQATVSEGTGLPAVRLALACDMMPDLPCATSLRAGLGETVPHLRLRAAEEAGWAQTWTGLDVCPVHLPLAAPWTPEVNR